MKIPLIKPYITDAIKKRVLAVLDSGHLTEGPMVREFEERCREYLGCKYSIAVTSCTVGLEIALRCLGIGKGDEVIVPDYTYPATADVVALVGAKTVLVDVDPHTMLIDYDALVTAITPATKAILPVSLFGNPLDYDRLAAIKDKYGIFIIEDAACALGAEYKGRKVGCLADITVFSLHPRKFITTGEGGLVVTDNATWAAWLTSYKKFGMDVDAKRADTSFARIGSNYKLSDILAALGAGQMQHINELLAKRKELAANYIDMLAGTSDVKLPKTTVNGSHSYQSFCVFVENRNLLLQELRQEGIEVQIGTYSLHRQPAFQPSSHCIVKGDLPGSCYAFEHCLALPLYHDMTVKDQETVIAALKSQLMQ